MTGHSTNIETDTLDNENFRKVLRRRTASSC